jgi:hypothetical protein
MDLEFEEHLIFEDWAWVHGRAVRRGDIVCYSE